MGLSGRFGSVITIEFVLAVTALSNSRSLSGPSTDLSHPRPHLRRSRHQTRGSLPPSLYTVRGAARQERTPEPGAEALDAFTRSDRKSTRLNSSHANISYAVFS